ncbi:hypothetical protein BUALT_Bualt18G0094500 [Buddleja alternifolia]|uniref:Uncharacterized protein n=1 Tax=Buddleja alternifolia TaxID=168488 RepID=A0AAV6WE85_9LAMI|nr:hypothetical protein BUALT_Bualt18G0094500 [Buddleja alternifolia]
MEIYATLLQYRYFFAAALSVSLGLVFFLAVIPKFTSILLYFWPLFLSTALVLATIVIIGQMSPIPSDFSGDREGEAFLDYIAGHPENY